MKKKDAKKQVKLQLNRETLRALEQPDLKVVQGGASDVYTCRWRDTCFNTCIC